MNLLSLVILTSFNLLLFAIAYEYQSKDRTLILNPILRLSSPRQRRSLLLPNYGSIKLTFGLAKGLIGSTPKGLSLSYELCSYFAGPTVIKDLLNELGQMKPKQQIIDKPNKTINSRVVHKRIQQKPTTISSYDFYKLNANSYKHPYLFKPHSFDPLISRSKYRHAVFKRSSSDIQPEVSNFERKSPLRDALDYLFGPKARCNILKQIVCRSKEILLPSGYSMIHDIIRILAKSLTKHFSSDSSGGGNSNFCEDKLFFNCM